MQLAETANVSVFLAIHPPLEVRVPFHLVATIWIVPVAKFAFPWINPSRMVESVVAWTPALANSADPTPFAWPTLTERLVSVAMDSREMPTSVANKNLLTTSAEEMMTVPVMPFVERISMATVSASILASLSPAPRVNLASSKPEKLIANVCPTLSAIHPPELAKNQDVSFKQIKLIIFFHIFY
jgi:hypothetical protein